MSNNLTSPQPCTTPSIFLFITAEVILFTNVDDVIHVTDGWMLRTMVFFFFLSIDFLVNFFASRL
ncbi:hypothetical protein ACJX0J_032489, partial [Zea mays]